MTIGKSIVNRQRAVPFCLPRHDLVVVEGEHKSFADVEDRHSDVSGLCQANHFLRHVHGHQVLVEYSKGPKVWLTGQPSEFSRVGDQFYVLVLSYVFLFDTTCNNTIKCVCTHYTSYYTHIQK